MVPGPDLDSQSTAYDSVMRSSRRLRSASRRRRRHRSTSPRAEGAIVGAARWGHRLLNVPRIQRRPGRTERRKYPRFEEARHLEKRDACNSIAQGQWSCTA